MEAQVDSSKEPGDPGTQFANAGMDHQKDLNLKRQLRIQTNLA